MALVNESDGTKVVNDIKPADGALLPLTEVTAEELAAPLAANMPDVTESKAVATSAPETPHAQPAPPITSDLQDRAGNAWNPERYKVNDDGSPRKDKAGYWIPKNKGKPPGAGSAATNPAVQSVMPDATKSGAQTAAPIAEQSKASIPIAGDGKQTPDKYDHAAEMYFNLLCPLACGLVSEEFQAGYSYDEKGAPFIDAKMRDMEKQSITVPLASYMRVNQKDELSPGWALTLASVGYIGRRAQMPQTQKKASSWVQSLKGLLGFGKK